MDPVEQPTRQIIDEQITLADFSLPERRAENSEDQEQPSGEVKLDKVRVSEHKDADGTIQRLAVAELRKSLVEHRDRLEQSGGGLPSAVGQEINAVVSEIDKICSAGNADAASAQGADTARIDILRIRAGELCERLRQGQRSGYDIHRDRTSTGPKTDREFADVDAGPRVLADLYRDGLEVSHPLCDEPDLTHGYRHTLSY